MPSCDALATRTADEEHLGVEQRRNAAQRVEPLGGVGTRAPWIRRACRRNDVGSVTTADAPQRPTSGYQMCAPDRDRAAAPATAIRSRCRATAEAVATELHELLQAPHIAGPYVLVAHCLGGAYAHPFALLYRLEVAGLVWLDAFRRDWDDFVPAGASLAAGEQMAPDLEQLRQALPFMRGMCADRLLRGPRRRPPWRRRLRRRVPPNQDRRGRERPPHRDRRRRSGRPAGWPRADQHR
jgi:hypothetical protein